MKPLIRPWLSNINLAIGYFTLTVTNPTYQNLGRVAAIEGNIIWAHYKKNQKNVQTSRNQQTEQYTKST